MHSGGTGTHYDGLHIATLVSVKVFISFHNSLLVLVKIPLSLKLINLLVVAAYSSGICRHNASPSFCGALWGGLLASLVRVGLISWT